MTRDRDPDEATLMAYADGELGPIERNRVEQAIASDPALAKTVAAHDGLRQRLGEAFAPIESSPVPDRLTAMLKGNVVAIERSTHRAAAPRRWLAGLALAASLALGIGLGTQLSPNDKAPVALDGGRLVAAGALAHALDTQLASASGETRILVSFRGANGYCRVFESAAADGIACRAGDQWRLSRTQSPIAERGGAYRQAGSAQAALMAAAQDMMIGEPLDAADEQRARALSWR